MGVPEMVMAGPAGVRVLPFRIKGELGESVRSWPAMVSSAADARGTGGVVMVAGDRVMLLPPTTKTSFDGEREIGVPDTVSAEPALRVVPSRTTGEPGAKVIGLPASVTTGSENPPGMADSTAARLMLLPPSTRAEPEGARDI